MHVYHYAPYEPTALKRLMGRYGTREDEVDRLLREGVMVDLLRVVRQSLRASVESYSIKKMEAFYGFVREIDLRDAGSSIVAFEQWLELGEGERPGVDPPRTDRALQPRRRRQQPPAARLAGGPARASSRGRPGATVPRPAARVAQLPPELTESQARVEALVERLAGPDVVPTDPAERTPTQQATWLLAQLLGWHRREDKSMWWEFHRLMDLTPEQLVDEDDPIGLLEPVGRARRACARASRPGATGSRRRTTTSGAARSTTRRRSRRAPTTTRSSGPSATVVADRSGGAHGRPEAARRRAAPARHRAAQLGPDDGPPGGPVRPRDMGRGPRDPGARAGPRRPRPAVRPAAAGRPVARRRRCAGPSESDLAAARRLALALDHTTLAIQGPPGSGKTFTGARMICSLLAAGKRVGITGTSHKVIGNLLSAVLDGRRGRGRRGSAGPEGRRRAGPRRPAGDAWQGRQPRFEPPRRRASEPRRRDLLAVGVAEDDRVGRRPVRRRGRPDLARQRHRGGPRERQPRAPRRPAAARPATPGQPSAGRGPFGPRPRPRRRRDHAARPRAVPREHLAAPPGPVRLHLRGLLRGSPRARADTSRDRASGPARASRTGRDRGCSTCPRSAPTTSRRSRREAVAALARAIVEGGTTWLDRLGDTPSRRLGGRPDRGAVQRPGRRDPAPPAAGRAGRDGGQVPGPGSPDQHLLDDDVVTRARAARDGLPVQPPPAERRDVAGPMRGHRRRLARPVPGARADSRADAPRQRVLPVRGDGPSVARPGPARSAGPGAIRAAEPSARDQLARDPRGQDAGARLDLIERDVLVRRCARP